MSHENAERCENCRFWFELDDFGYCKRRAPVTSGQIGVIDKYPDYAPEDAIWPVTHRMAWCGEFQARKPAPETTHPLSPPWYHPKQYYRCQVYLVPEKEGGYSALATDLPGATSQGETKQEALANIREALEGLIASYLDLGNPVPWSMIDTPDLAEVHVVMVRVPSK